MNLSRPLVVTGQQIGAGWTPALSVVKALAAVVEAEKLGGEAVFWMADEDHDALEVATTVGLEGSRLRRHRFRFHAPEGTATGWLPWTPAHQAEAEGLWGQVPETAGATLRDHFLACGAPLWQRGLRPFSPTEPALRGAIQDELARWRGLELDAALIAQAEALEKARLALPLDPRSQGAWFSLNPASGLRQRLESSEPCPPGHWLSPGAALRPLMQQLLLPATAAVILGPAERAYWRLTEPLWDLVGLQAPRIVARPSAFVQPRGSKVEVTDLESLRLGDWKPFADSTQVPSKALPLINPGAVDWSEALRARFQHELERTRTRLERLDRRLLRDRAAARFGMDPEVLRQALYPFGRPQERVLPGLYWLRDSRLLDRLIEGLRTVEGTVLVEES